MISLIITVKNEAEVLGDWIASVTQQSTPVDEIIIVDGGSNDATWRLLQTAQTQNEKIKIFQFPSTIAAGRNYAITQASGDIIVATDAGCIYEPNWLAQLVAPLLAGAQFATTAFRPWLTPHDSIIRHALAAATTPSVGEFRRDWLPSSRSVAFTKAAWQSVGGYPDWLPYTEDVVFDLALAQKGVRPTYIRAPLVAWRPRVSVSAYMRQLYNYTRCDALAQLFFIRQLIRFVTYGGLLVCIALSYFYSLGWLVPPFVGGVVYMAKFWQRSWEFSKQKSAAYRALVLLILPVIIAIGDIAKIEGWIVGYIERRQGKIKPPTI